MKQALVTWIGEDDLRAITEPETVGVGPVALALEARDYDEVVLLTNLPLAGVSGYADWLQFQTLAQVSLRPVAARDPDDYGAVHTEALSAIAEMQVRLGGETRITFHMASGTPAARAVFIVLARTRFAAELIDCDPEGNIRTASAAFDIPLHYLSNLTAEPDEELVRLAGAPPPDKADFGELVYSSGAMAEVVGRARLIAPRNVPLLIEGEDGTGKETLARAIHRRGLRRHGPFVAVRCAGTTPEMLEIELFGYEKATAQGPQVRRVGACEAANGGTLFLDEVEALSGQAQARLVRLVERGLATRSGTYRGVPVDVRVIAATNAPLSDMAHRGRFREDLFYRLCVARLVLPALRERGGDAVLIAGALLSRINQQSSMEPGYVPKTLSEGAKRSIAAHAWPGNVRELENTLRRVSVWSPEPEISEETLADAMFTGPSGDLDIPRVLNLPLSDGVDLQELLSTVARHYLERALEETGGNKTQAAKLLGLANYQTLTNWLKKYEVNG
ncbi:MAG: sigma 54-interacting transcriptional regulator [Desulfatibacillaceae bacterium]